MTEKKLSMEAKVETLLSKMTLKEKVGQCSQAPYFSNVLTGHDVDPSGTLEGIRKGEVGSILSVHDEDTLRFLQKTAVEESRLKIPLLFCFDVIHGFKTAFPINLALSTSWDPELIESVSEAVAYETTHGGIHLVFSPMVDLVRDPRWGRVMESNGEDPYLSSVLSRAYVRGYQGHDLADKHRVAACVKHFAGYGFVEAGREYNTVDISERVLRTMVLPPFQATIDEGVSMVMTAFNTVFDRPATANRFLLTDLLRDEMGFHGVTISDYTSTEEIIHHKVAKDEKDAAEQCFNAGLDHEMVSKTYQRHLAALIEEGRVSLNALEAAVRRILKLKFALGLFDNPYRNLYADSTPYMLKEETKKLALEAAEKSIVMLENKEILPLSKSQKIALIGPFIDSQDTIGEWPGLTRKEDVISLLKAFMDHQVTFDSFDDLPANVSVLSNYDVVLIALGEDGFEAGEGNSKVDIHLKESQRALFDEVVKVNKNCVLIVFAGRPLIMTDYVKKAKAILYAYQPGTMTGPALYNLLYGITSPSAKLTMTMPRHQGQIPLYYNHYQTGRPFDYKRPDYRYNSRYRDISNEPLYAFGYGLSYGSFAYTNLELDKAILTGDDTLNVTVDVTNDSDVEATEIVQCYIEVSVFSVSRPVNELKGFKRVHFMPHETKTITFVLTVDDFRSYNVDMHYTAENHRYKVKVGGASTKTIEATVHVIDKS